MKFSINSRQAAEDPDADLIHRISRGDPPAFAELVDRHLHSVVAQAVRMLGDRAAAEDIAQTVFLKVWRTLPNWNFGQAKLLTWIRRVTYNLCIDQLRNNRLSFPGELPDQIDQQANQIDHLITQDENREILQALAKLPETQRAAISLSYFEDVSQRQGAEILNITESAYESLLVRARKSLRRTLFKEQEFQVLTGGKK